jgi:hypothetical protein
MVMSILDQEMSFEDPQSERVAKELLFTTKRTYEGMVMSFNRGSQAFWTQTPEDQQAVLNILGTNAREVFELHGKLGAFLAEIDPEKIQEGLSVVGTFTYNEDGTITLG